MKTRKTIQAITSSEADPQLPPPVISEEELVEDIMTDSLIPAESSTSSPLKVNSSKINPKVLSSIKKISTKEEIKEEFKN
ncbi:hypothetical protein ACLOJK_016488 [Asimina triloba]